MVCSDARPIHRIYTCIHNSMLEVDWPVTVTYTGLCRPLYHHCPSCVARDEVSPCEDMLTRHPVMYSVPVINNYVLALAAAAPAGAVVSDPLDTGCGPSELGFIGLLLASGGGLTCGGIKLEFRDGLIANSAKGKNSAQCTCNPTRLPRLHSNIHSYNSCLLL